MKNLISKYLITASVPGRLGWIFLIFISTTHSFAQLKFSGLGRTVFQSQQLSGDALKNDSLSDRNTSQGYALFDLRTNYQIKDKFRILVDTRLKNTIGGFGGVGISLNLRQVRIEGLASKFVKYSVGDVDIKMSPFTFSNSSEIELDIESTIFSRRREVVQYESFNVNNHWRMRGLKLNSVVNLKGDSNQLKILVFGTTDRATDSYTKYPIRIGGSIAFEKKEKFFLEGNMVRTEENQKETGNAQIQVFSTRTWYLKHWKKWALGGTAELGQSNSIRETGVNTTQKLNDYFYEGKCIAINKNQDWKIWAAYQEVGPFFESPGAQSLRISGNRSSQFFTYVSNNQQIRSQGMLDRMGSETIQNINISSFRQPYLPQYNLVFPYGKATPNRKGFDLGLLDINNRFLDYSFQYHQSGEVLGEGVVEKRSFHLLQSAFILKINRILNSNRKRSLYANYRFESSGRKGDLPTDLQINTVDVGATVEIFKKFDLHLGMKRIQAKGNEVYSQINSYNSISGYLPYAMTQSENLIGTGIQLHFTDHCFLLVSGYFNRIKTTEALLSWNLNQLYTNFSYEF